MQMGVVEKSLSPCVEYREESDLRPQMLGIGRNGAQCLAGRPEQNVVDDVLILKGNGCDWLRHGDYGLKWSRSGVCRALARLGNLAAPTYQQLQSELRQ